MIEETARKKRHMALVKAFGGVVKLHGLSHTPEYAAWNSMLSRCGYRGAVGDPAYFGRGIKVCQQWQDSFVAFLADMGFRPSPEHSLDRINVHGHYEPTNCRWATREEQARNTQRARRVYLFDRTYTISELAEGSGLSASTIRGRLRKGWSVERAVFDVPKPRARPMVEDRPEPTLHKKHSIPRQKTRHYVRGRGNARRVVPWVLG